MTEDEPSYPSWPDPNYEPPPDPEVASKPGLDSDFTDEVDPQESNGDESEHSNGRSFIANIVEWAVLIVGALVVALVIRAFVFQAFYIPSESMEQTLIENDRVIVNKLSYRLHDVNRGDLVVFRRPPSEPPTEIPELIKRVIALPGETIEGRDGIVYIDGQRLVEPYVAEDSSLGAMGSFGPVLVPEGHVFVMGDNRNNSRDSRVFGPIEEDSIVGRAFILVWPPSRWAFL